MPHLRERRLLSLWGKWSCHGLHGSPWNSPGIADGDDAMSRFVATVIARLGGYGKLVLAHVCETGSTCGKVHPRGDWLGPRSGRAKV